MKIVNIEINKESDTETSFIHNNAIKFPLTVTTKNWVGRKRTFIAYPTDEIIFRKSDTCAYRYFVDELGVFFSDSVSRQLYKFVIKEELKRKLQIELQRKAQKA